MLFVSGSTVWTETNQRQNSENYKAAALGLDKEKREEPGSGAREDGVVVGKEGAV